MQIRNYNIAEIVIQLLPYVYIRPEVVSPSFVLIKRCNSMMKLARKVKCQSSVVICAKRLKRYRAFIRAYSVAWFPRRLLARHTSVDKSDATTQDSRSSVLIRILFCTYSLLASSPGHCSRKVSFISRRIF